MATIRSMSSGGPEDVVLADAGAVLGLVDEADEAVGEVVLPADLLRQRARGVAGADDQHPLLEVRVVREMVEGQPPRQHRDEEHAERGDEDARAEHQRRKRDAGEARGRSPRRRPPAAAGRRSSRLEWTTVRS